MTTLEEVVFTVCRSFLHGRQLCVDTKWRSFTHRLQLLLGHSRSCIHCWQLQKKLPTLLTILEEVVSTINNFTRKKFAFNFGRSWQLCKKFPSWRSFTQLCMGTKCRSFTHLATSIETIKKLPSPLPTFEEVAFTIDNFAKNFLHGWQL